jgi:putative ABC transport system permease protein
MVRPKDVFAEAYRSLRHNRLRSALTMLGMAWGIATVVLLLAYGTGFSTAIVNIFRSYASMSAMGIAGGRTSMQAGGNKAGTSIRLTRDDIDRVVVNVPEVTRITPESFFDASVGYEGRSYTWRVDGGNPSLQEIQNLQLVSVVSTVQKICNCARVSVCWARNPGKSYFPAVSPWARRFASAASLTK